MEIISDKESRWIVVAAGPGSGKIRVLVHKLASLLLLEDVKTRKNDILALRSGQALRFVDNYLYECGSNKVVAILSQKMQEELQQWTGKGYGVVSASIRFIVAWRPKDALREEECAVSLMDLMLKKKR